MLEIEAPRKGASVLLRISTSPVCNRSSSVRAWTVRRWLKAREDLNQGLVFHDCDGANLGAKKVTNRVLAEHRGLQSNALEAELVGHPQISVIDDDQSFRDSMRRLLSSMDYAVKVFPNANEFLESSDLTSTDCIIADIHMPAMTGFELFEHLINSGRAIPTILVTAYPDEAARRRTLALGVQCYLPKPLVETDLIDCLHFAIARGNRI